MKPRKAGSTIIPAERAQPMTKQVHTRIDAQPGLELFSAAFSDPSHTPFVLPGSGLAVVLIHGFPGTPAEMRPIGETLNQAGWHTQGLLLPGLGPEIGKLDKITFDDWLSAVIHALTELKQRFAKVAVIGFSMGGSLAATATARGFADAAVLLAPYWRMSRPFWGLLPLFRRITPAVKPFKLMQLDFSDQEFRRGMLTFMPGIDLDNPEVQSAIRDFTFPIKILDQIVNAGKIAGKETYNLKAPTLVMQGTRDELVTPLQTREFSRRIPGLSEYLEVEAKHDLPDPSKPAWNLISTKSVEFLSTLQP